jgi:hypothetical protein
MAKGMIIGLVAAGAVAVGGISLFGYAGSVQKAGVNMEQGLNAQYQVDQLDLDTGIKEIKESVGIANIKNAQLDKILSDAVRGRYDGNSSAQPGKGQLFSAIQEAYPNVDVSIYDRIIDKEFAFREHFKQEQIIFRDQLRQYDVWRTEGLIKPILVRMLGYPSQNLEARIGFQTWHGVEALDHMKVLVTSEETDTSFQTGHENPIDLPGAPAAPAPVK